ncbi:MAG TPA: hypothetical protein VI172_06650 [Candidatus Dormibacteraeota bacterium]|jgi:hypothetical protein
MSGTTEETEETGAAEVVTIQPVHDFYLQALVTLLEQLDENSSMSMSFNVNGGLVYGQLITRADWEKLWVANVRQAHEWTGDVLDAIVRDAGERTGDEPAPSNFVHLKDAWFMSGNMRQRLSLWRGPLAQIGGWSHSIPGE